MMGKKPDDLGSLGVRVGFCIGRHLRRYGSPWSHFSGTITKAGAAADAAENAMWCKLWLFTKLAVRKDAIDALGASCKEYFKTMVFKNVKLSVDLSA